MAAENFASFVFDDVADGDALVVRHTVFPVEAFFRESADFEEDGSGLGVDVEDLGVGGVAIIIIADPATGGEEAGGVGHGVAESPAADIELVRALVAEIAISVGRLPVPIVVELAPADGEDFAGAGPEVIIYGLGRGHGSGDFTNGFPGLVAEATGEGELADLALLYPSEDVVPGLLGAALESVGDGDAVVGLAEGEFFPFPDVMRDGLFDVDVLASSGCAEGDEGVGVIAGGDADGIDLGVLADFTVVGVGLEAGELVAFFEFGLSSVELVGVDITEADEARFFMRNDAVDMSRASAFDADDDDAELAICTRGAGMGSEEGKGACVEGGAEEVTAVHYFEKVWKWFLRVALSKSPDWRTRRYFCVRD